MPLIPSTPLTYSQKSPISRAAACVAASRCETKVVEAPDPNLDLNWNSILKGQAARTHLHFLVGLLTAGLITFFVIPVGYLNRAFGSAAMHRRADAYGWSWWTRALTQYFVPTTVVLCTNLLPPLFTWLGFMGGEITWSTNAFRQLDRMMWFLLVNVYGVCMISGTAVDTLLSVASDPSGTTLAIGHILPEMSGFFTQYMLIATFLALSFELCRGLPLVHMVLRFVLRINDTTERDRMREYLGLRRFNNPGWFQYGRQYAYLLLNLLVCLSFAPIAPLVLVPGLLYFVYAQLVYRNALAFVYEPRFEVGGGFWPVVLKWVVRIMVMSQLFMMCIFSLRRYFTGASAMVLLVATTVAFGRQFQEGRDAGTGLVTQLPMEVAYFLDRPPGERARSSAAIFQAHVKSADAIRRNGHAVGGGSSRAPPCFVQPSLRQNGQQVMRADRSCCDWGGSSSGSGGSSAAAGMGKQLWPGAAWVVACCGLLREAYQSTSGAGTKRGAQRNSERQGGNSGGDVAL